MTPTIRCIVTTAAAIGLGAPAAPAFASGQASILDPEAPERPAELRLGAGRETRVPVSFTPAIRRERRGEHELIASARCEYGDAALLVRQLTFDDVVLATFFNADAGGTADPIVRVPAEQRGDFHYQIIPFSEQRGTSRCTVDLDWGSGDRESLGTLELGGTLLDIGPMAAKELVEVRTLDDGRVPQTDTFMVVFDLDKCASDGGETCRSARASILSMATADVPDDDPRVTLPDDRPSGRNFALVAREVPVLAPETFPEIKVDVVRGPLDDTGTDGLGFRRGVGDAVLLRPGRYYTWVYASTRSPTGSRNVVSSDVFNLRVIGLHFGPSECRAEEAWANRGQLNGPAFAMTLQRREPTGPAWETVATRDVAIGAIGGSPTTDEPTPSRFIIELEVTTEAWYRPTATLIDPFVEIDDHWGFVRNPDASELKVASLNMWYDHSTVEEYQNAADLLTGRVAAKRGSPVVLEEDDRSPYEWEADLASLQEGRGIAILAHDPSDWLSPYDLFDVFKQRAEARGAPFEWTAGMSENTTLNEGWAATMIGASLWPRSPSGELDPATVGWGMDDLRPATCSGGTGAGDGAANMHHIRCLLRVTEAEGSGHDADGWWIETDNYSIPAPATVRRLDAIGAGAGNDRPIGVFTIHLNSGDARGADDRFTEMNRVADLIEDMLGRTPEAFNPTRSTRRLDPGNRFIVIGDSNGYCHDCGEHYWLLDVLRERFGYAVDAAMAVDGSFVIGSGMHNFGPEQSAFVPEEFQHRRTWPEQPEDVKWALRDSVPPQRFPWWARTFRGPKPGESYPGERHDIVFLVGRGWAGDDPVRDYAVMQDNARPNPYAVAIDGVVGGVEMMYGSGEGSIPNAWPGYRPRHAVKPSESATNGGPALMTDHRPIGARLRVFTEAQFPETIPGSDTVD
jgi:hypothetical protein